MAKRPKPEEIIAKLREVEVRLEPRRERWLGGQVDRRGRADLLPMA